MVISWNWFTRGGGECSCLLGISFSFCHNWFCYLCWQWFERHGSGTRQPNTWWTLIFRLTTNDPQKPMLTVEMKMLIWAFNAWSQVLSHHVLASIKFPSTSFHLALILIIARDFLFSIIWQFSIWFFKPHHPIKCWYKLQTDIELEKQA